MRTGPFALLIFAAALLSCDQPPPPASPNPSAARPVPAEAPRAGQPPPAAALSPRQVVEEFGARLKNVSLLAPPDVVARAMDEQYSRLVTKELLRSWKDDPSTAPGRQVSSPWPDRIEVTRVGQPAENAAVVSGEIVGMTSSGEAERRAVTIELVRSDGSWLVDAFRFASPSSPNQQDDQHRAVKVIEEYYAAIARRDYSTAWHYWGTSGPPDQTLEQFSSGFADTKTVEVETGTPSRIEAAAGSRYIDVPVTITAKETDGHIRRFSGTYTLRRAVVDGATPEQRRWHIGKAAIREIS